MRLPYLAVFGTLEVVSRVYTRLYRWRRSVAA